MGANSYLQGAFFVPPPLKIEDRLCAPLESSDMENSLLLIIHIINLIHHSYWVTSTFCWPGVFHTHNDQTQLQQQLAALCLYGIDPFRWARLSPLLEQALASLLHPLFTPFHFYWAVAGFFEFLSALRSPSSHVHSNPDRFYKSSLLSVSPLSLILRKIDGCQKSL